jgi:hypothetical protein
VNTVVVIGVIVLAMIGEISWWVRMLKRISHLTK